MERRKKLRMGETLVSQGLITVDQLRIGLKEQKATGLPIGRQLVALGFITEAVLRDQLANALGSQGIDLTQVVATPKRCSWCPRNLRAVITCCRSPTMPRATC